MMTTADSSPATEYATWSGVRQRRHLTELVGTVLAQYPITVGSVRLVQMAFNATFRVEGTIDGSPGRWAVRLNAQGLRSAAETAAELAWLTALGEQSDVRVPRVVRSTDGLPMVAVPSEPLARHVTGVMFEWLPGRLLREEPRPAELQRLGRIMAQLHDHGETWTPPDGASLPRIDDPRMGLDDHLADHPMLDATQRSIIGEVVDRAASTFAALGTRAPHVVHGDLHPGNLMTAGGALAVLDFDDCGLSHPLHDLAITAYHLRPAPHEGPLFAGYRSVRPLPEHTHEQFESLVASRNVALLTDTVTVDAAWVRELLPTYVPNTVTKLRNYLDTGVYRHDVDGLIG
jgi:Ser/Thr protein kinase RdoA (MazF antagonist)